MGVNRVRGWIAIVVILAVPALAHAQEADADRHGDRHDRWGSSGCHDCRPARSLRQQLQYRNGCARQLSLGGARRHLQGDQHPVRLSNDLPVPGAAPQPDRGPESADGRVGRPGDVDGDRRIAVAGPHLVGARRQYRPAADVSAAGQRPRLDATAAAGAGRDGQRDFPRSDQPGFRRQQFTGHDQPRLRQLSDQRRRAADHRAHVDEPAAVQPRLDFRAGAAGRPLRRDDGTLDGRDRQRRDPFGVQPLDGEFRRVLPGQQIQCGRLRRQDGDPVLGYAAQHGIRRTDQEGQGALLRPLRVPSTSRGRWSSRCLRPGTRRCRTTTTKRSTAAGSTSSSTRRCTGCSVPTASSWCCRGADPEASRRR